MKKILYYLPIFVFLTAFTCDNEPLEGDFGIGTGSCPEATQATAQASLNFINATANTYQALCVAYRTALENQIALCGDTGGALQAAIDALGDCSNGVSDEEIEGTWQLTAWIGEEPIDINGDGTESLNFLDEFNCYENEFLVFEVGGTGESESNSYAEIEMDLVVGTTNDYEYQVNCIQEVEVATLTWTQSGNSISITSDGENFDKTLSGNTLSIFVPEGFFAANEDFLLTTIQDLTFVYIKQ